MIAPGVLGVKIIGRLDSMSTGSIWQKTDLELDKTSPKQVIVDASEIEYCDGSGIGYLFGLRQRMEKGGGDLKIRGLHEEFQQLLDLFDPSEFEESQKVKSGSVGFFEKIGQSACRICEEAYAAFEFVGEVGPQFGEQDQEGGRLETGDGGQVNAQHAVRLGAQIELGFIALGGAMGRFGRRQGMCRHINARIAGGQVLLELEVAGADLILVMLPGLEALAQGKEMFWTPIALETAGDGVGGGFDAMILEGGQLAGIALALQNGLDNGQSGDTGQVADDVLELNVHLGQGLVHEPDLIGGTTDETAAMPKEGAEGANQVRGTKAGIEQAHRVEILEPLTVLDVGLAAGEILAMTGIDQADLEASRIEDLEEGNPIDAGGFHGDGGDATGLEPVAQAEQRIGEGRKRTDRFGVGVGRDGDPDFAGTDVDAGGVEVEGGERAQRRGDFFLGLLGARGHNMPLVNREWRADGPQRRIASGAIS